MKRFILLLSALLLAGQMTSQNVINPYQNYTDPPVYPPIGSGLPFTVYSLHPDELDDLINGWTGEYEIAMKDHF